MSIHSSLFSGLRGGTFLCILSRLNRRMKHLLFRTLLQQEVHFFEKNDPGEMNTRYRVDVPIYLRDPLQPQQVLLQRAYLLSLVRYHDCRFWQQELIIFGFDAQVPPKNWLKFDFRGLWALIFWGLFMNIVLYLFKKKPGKSHCCKDVSATINSRKPEILFSYFEILFF